MDDPVQIGKLLKAYQAKNMPIAKAKASLIEQGYTMPAIQKVILASGYHAHEEVVPTVPQSENPDWAKVANAMLTEKRRWSQTASYGYIFLLGAYSGYQVYGHWINRTGIGQHQTCHMVMTLQGEVNKCYILNTNLWPVIICILVGGFAAVILAKISYSILNKRIKNQEAAAGNDPSSR